MPQRIKGQDTECLVIMNGTPMRALSAVKSHEFTYELEIKAEGYIGETSERYDSIFMGMSGKLDLHLDTPDIFDLVDLILEVAKGRQPGAHVNIKTTFRFPNGARRRVVIPEVSFGAVPFSTGSRADYVGSSLTYKASDGKVIK